MRIFGRLTELIIERLNQTPEKNFLAFLDLIGTQIQPPQPARVPLTFQLAAGSPADTRVPARTQVAAPATEGEAAEVLYETDQELIVTTSRLVAVFVRNPDTDRYGNYTLLATDDSDSAFAAFQGDQPIEHSLYLGRDDFFTLPAPKSARLTIDSPDAVRLAALPVVWSYSDGATWHVLNTIQSALPAADRWEVTIANLPAPAITDRNGLQAGWLRAQLDIPLPRGDYDAGKHEIRRSGLPPDMAIAGQTEVDLSRPFSPFSQSGIGAAFFYLRVDEAFVRAGATVTLTISLAQSGRASSDLLLRWSYSDGSNWKPLGESRPTNASAGTDAFAFADETLAFTQNGTSQFIVPPDWRPQPLFNEVGRWLRVQIAEGNYGAGTELRLPHIETLTASYAWTLPEINQIEASVQVQRHDLVPELGFANALPLDLTKDFFPFGEKPRLSDTLYLAHQEVFARPGAAVMDRCHPQ